MKVQPFLSGAALATACLCLPQIAAARSNTAILSGIEAPLTLKNTTVDASTYQLADRGRGRGGDGRGDRDRGGDRGRGGDRDHDSRGCVPACILKRPCYRLVELLPSSFGSVPALRLYS